MKILKQKTTTYLILTFTLIFAAAARSQTWDGKKNGERSYPLGVLGGTAIVYLGKPDFEIKSLMSGEAGQKGGLKLGDRIIAANGKEFEEYDNDIHSGGKGGPQGLGEALDYSLGKGTLSLTVLRGGREVELKITVPKWGSLGDEWPMDDNPRVQAFREGVCEYLNDMINGKKGRITIYGCSDMTKCMAGLALLASGDASYKKTIRELAHHIKDTTIGNGNWAIYYYGVFLSEYYLATRDESVLEWMQEGVDTIKSRMSPKGHIGHGGSFPDAMYGHAAGFNPVGSGCLWFMALADKCGIEVDLKLWDSTAEWLGKSSGGNSAIGYSMWARGGNDAHARSSKTLIGLCVAQKKKALRNSIGEYLENYPGSLRESHAYSAEGVFTTFLALYMHDQKEYQRQLNLWKWYFTLAEGPDHIAYYIGSKRNNGGDEYLGRQGIFNATMGIILSAPKQTIYMYGGIPAIPGISPGSLSPALLRIVKSYTKNKPVRNLSSIRSYVNMNSRGKNGKDAILIGRYIFNEQVNPYWQEVLDLNATGDLYKTKDLFRQFVLDCGKPPPLKDEIEFIEWTLESKRGRTTIKRGEIFYNLVQDWADYPLNRPRLRQKFELLAKDESDIYGKKSLKTVAQLEQNDRQKEEQDNLSEEELNSSRSIPLEI